MHASLVGLLLFERSTSTASEVTLGHFTDVLEHFASEASDRRQASHVANRVCINKYLKRGHSTITYSRSYGMKNTFAYGL